MMTIRSLYLRIVRELLEKESKAGEDVGVVNRLCSLCARRHSIFVVVTCCFMATAIILPPNNTYYLG
jgi:hypothetical protein